MRLFVEFQNFYRMLGIDPSQLKRNKRSAPVTFQICLILFISLLAFILTGFFCLFQSQTMREFGDSFYATATVPGVLWLFSAFFVNMREVFILIKHFEQFIEKSEHLKDFHFK